MAFIRLLYELQGVDLELEQRRGRLVEVERALGDDSRLVSLRAEVEGLQRQQVTLHAEQRDIELQAAELEEKLSRLRDVMYGGTVTNPKELQGMHEEEGHLQRRKAAVEEPLLNAMVVLEECQQALNSARTRLKEEETAWRQAQEELRRERESLLQEVEKLSVRRQAVAAQVRGDELATYEQVRRTHRGQAVAIVERSMCQACHVRLPNRELQQVRTSSGLVQCSNCGRLLLAT